MSNSFTNQILAQIYLDKSKNYSNDVYMLPKKLDEKVAMLHLDALGVELEKLNKTQSDYLGLKIEGHLGQNITDIKFYLLYLRHIKNT